MIKMKRRIMLMIAMALVLLFGLTACSKEIEFDAAGYVQCSLDAVYHGEYKKYAEMLDVSEEEAKADLEKDFLKSMEKEFADFKDITEGGIDAFNEQVKKADKLAKYQVMGAEKTDDGNYKVRVKAEPSDIYQTLEQSAAGVSEEKISQGLNPMEPQVFESIMIESVQKSIDKNTYGEPVTIEVSVTKDDSKAYGISDADMEKLRSALFPAES